MKEIINNDYIDISLPCFYIPLVIHHDDTGISSDDLEIFDNTIETLIENIEAEDEVVISSYYWEIDDCDEYFFTDRHEFSRLDACNCVEAKLYYKIEN